MLIYITAWIILFLYCKITQAIPLIVTVIGLLVCTRAEAARRWTSDVDTRAGVWIMPLISHWSVSTACVCPRSFCASVIKKQAHRIWWLSSITRGCSLQLWKARISVSFCYVQISNLIFSETYSELHMKSAFYLTKSAPKENFKYATGTAIPECIETELVKKLRWWTYHNYNYYLWHDK